jgi:hypothetical protein
MPDGSSRDKSFRRFPAAAPDLGGAAASFYIMMWHDASSGTYSSTLASTWTLTFNVEVNV